MPSIAVDAGPLIALLKGAHRHYGAAVAFIQRSEGPLVTNLVVISEVVALISISYRTSFLTWAPDAFVIDRETAGDLPHVVEIMSKHTDLPADFADAFLVALCERRGISDVATLDKGFDVCRTADRKRLRNVFFAHRPVPHPAPASRASGCDLPHYRVQTGSICPTCKA